MSDAHSGLPATVGEVIGNYRLDEVIGRGGMGAVYRATHVLLGRPAAVKVLADEFASDDSYVSRFFHEAKIVNEARHPNIIDVTDFVATDAPRRVAYVMEYVVAPTLSQVMKLKTLTVQQAANIGLQLIDTLSAVHRLGVVHRDLKPDNVMVTGDLDGDMTDQPSVKVLDFGIAKVADEQAAHQTAAGSILGTPSYMAPEQITGDPVSAATDIYAVGELLHEMVTGQKLFTGTNMAILRSKITALPVLQAPPNTPGGPRLAALVKACLAIEPGQRPLAEHVQAALTAVLQECGAGGVAMPLPPGQQQNTLAGDLTPANFTYGQGLAAPKRTGLSVAVWVVGLMTIAAVAGLGWWYADGGFVVTSVDQPWGDVTPLPSADPPPPKVKTVELTTRPRNAWLYEPGTDTKIGEAPMTLSLEIGQKRQIEIRNLGYVYQTITIDGAQPKVHVELVAEPKKALPKPKPKPAAATPKPAADAPLKMKVPGADPAGDGVLHKKELPSW